jgi:hypothetical protein
MAQIDQQQEKRYSKNAPDICILFAQRAVEDGVGVLGLVLVSSPVGRLRARRHFVHLLHVPIQRAHRGELQQCSCVDL